MDKCIGVMEATIRESGIKEYNMGKGKFLFLEKAGKKVFSKIMF